ncbi:hypothetical protein B0H10DRAFT_2211425 [Mycena sp. CBHHK59/15]|nr:hypothetical protein B0H10DRAFT_2211425 [Mycena sp. CBHHK59/15]
MDFAWLHEIARQSAVEARSTPEQDPYVAAAHALQEAQLALLRVRHGSEDVQKELCTRIVALEASAAEVEEGAARVLEERWALEADRSSLEMDRQWLEMDRAELERDRAMLEAKGAKLVKYRAALGEGFAELVRERECMRRAQAKLEVQRRVSRQAVADELGRTIRALQAQAAQHPPASDSTATAIATPASGSHGAFPSAAASSTTRMRKRPRTTLPPAELYSDPESSLAFRTRFNPHDLDLDSDSDSDHGSLTFRTMVGTVIHP